MTVQSSPTTFADRHIGARRQSDIDTMLKAVGYDTLDGLVDSAVPDSIRQDKPLTLEGALSEVQVLAELRKLAGKNKMAVQMIGQGYYDTVTPPVIRRNILEAPAWYTAYTPYQPEISQGRLEALLNFQTMVQDLTALPVANASLLDEATAVAEAVLLMRRANKSKTAKDGKTVLDADLLPQTISIVLGRAEALGFEVEIADLTNGLPDGDINGVVLQQPGVSGRVWDQSAVIAEAKERGALVTVAADLLALTLITPPGEQGADIAVGSTQRFGVPLFFGGPHAAYMAVRDGMERTLPGRIVGVSKDNAGVPAYRLALQTREQHIRREKATSNICTAQALLAIVSSFYAVYHGPDGLKAIAETVHNNARALAATLKTAGRELVSDTFFDTLTVSVPGKAAKVITAAEARGINLRLIDADTVGVSVDETTTPEVLAAVAVAFGAGPVVSGEGFELPESVLRTSGYLQHPVFNTHRSETQLLRYIRRLSDRDLALDRTMIPLGSCTMKLNATAEMEAISWPEFASIHPFAPDSQTEGWRELIAGLEADLAEITGYDQVSIQPNAGSQGELAGLLAIRGYHHSRGDQQRNVCLIPASAHGTNAASAVLAGMKVVVVATAADGTIDRANFQQRVPQTGGVLIGDVDLEAVLAGVPGAGQQQVLPVNFHLDGRVILQLRHQGVLIRRNERQQDGLGVRSLHRDEGGLGGNVVYGDVEAGSPLSQRRGHNLGVAGVGHHKVLVFTPPVGNEVVDDAAVFLADQRVLGLAHGNRGQLAGQGVVQEGCGVRAGYPHFAHVGEVEQSGGVADSVVFGQLGVVLQGHLPAAEVGEGCAGNLVLLIERGVVLSHHGILSSQTRKEAGRSRPGCGPLPRRRCGRPAGSTCPAGAMPPGRRPVRAGTSGPIQRRRRRRPCGVRCAAGTSQR